jgi:hypothetical protein
MRLDEEKLPSNGRALSRAALYSEKTLKPKPAAKMRMILSPLAASDCMRVLSGVRFEVPF